MLLTNSSASGRASLGRAGGRCGGGLPAGRQQDTQVVQVGHGRQALEHVGQPDLGVVAVAYRAIARPTAEHPRSSGFPSARYSGSLTRP
jgi:hypothetical protein